MNDILSFSGFFKHIIFKSEDNYTVCEFVSNDRNETYMIVVGYIGEILKDTPYVIHGVFKEHIKYGHQFSLLSYEKQLPNDEESLIRYFSSSIFKGIGKIAAKKIVLQLGKDAINLLKEDNSIIEQLDGLNDKQKISLKEGLELDIDDSIIFFTQNGLSMKQIARIEAVYEERSVELVKNNPYRMVSDIDGIGFKTCDRLGINLGFKEDDPKRIKAAIITSVLNICMRFGDTYCDRNTLLKEMKKDFGFNDETLFEQFLEELIAEQQLFDDNGYLYHKSQYEAEQGIADFFKLFELNFKNDCNNDHLDEKIADLEKRIGIEYESKQKEAIKTFFNESFSILTGGPGTGKTTIVRAIIELYRNMYPNSRIALCAPTGRASKRLTQLADYPATTIHSLLKWDLETNTFSVNHDNPIEADLLIADESSMVDSWLFYHLLDASNNIKKILLIGDEDQLPSVGPGFILRDLIGCDIFPITRLEKIYRQSEGSDVIRLAHDIKEGRCDIIDHANEVKMFECANYEVKNMVTSIYKNALDKGYDEMYIQVLVPMYKGVAGINEINSSLQELCNPKSNNKKEIWVGNKLLRVNDKVLQLKNQPDDNVYNGDIGRIVDISYSDENYDNDNIVTCEFDDTVVVYNSETISNITHAYCISVHKSQGSEYPIVIMPILKDYIYMLERRIIYTGISRAKKSLVLLGDKQMLINGINRKDRHERRTLLQERIKANYH